MRALLVLLFTIAVGSSCGDKATLQKEPAGGENQVTIDVKCNAKEVTVTVDPFQAHARPGEPMIWKIKANAHVTELEINSSTGSWPFSEALPYKSKPNAPAQATQRAPGWTSGANTTYRVSGLCRGPNGAVHPFVLDPDMIVD